MLIEFPVIIIQNDLNMITNVITDPDKKTARELSHINSLIYRTPPRPLLTIIYVIVARNILKLNNTLPCVVYNIWFYKIQTDCQT